MPYRKVTYSEEHSRVSIYNVGCNFACRGCSYRLLQPESGPPLAVEDIEAALMRYQPRLVTFLGGEPTTNPDLPRLLAFAKNEIGAETWLGHTNGSHLPMDNLDGANVSFKAFSPDTHLYYTGQPAAPVYDNFRAAFDAGLKLKASTVLIPGLVDVDEVEAIASFIAGLSKAIPFHVAAYVPVPGAPWQGPSPAHLAQAVAAARRHLQSVTSSCLTPDELKAWQQRSPRWASVRVL
jgi:pyruvate formate lyase activating enzyme